VGIFAYFGAVWVAQLFQDKEGDTPLSFAVQNGHTAAAQLLLDQSAYVDARNVWGETPLFRARSLKLEDLLLEHGANRNAMDFANRTEMKF
jgi:ankyrin repeat protein